MTVFPIKSRKIEIILAVALVCNIGFWLSVRSVKSQWGNVPPAPKAELAASSGLGDTQLSYRIIGIMLQNLGDTGGRTTALKDYDFAELSKWFFVQNSLDHHSNYIPYLAAYYYSATQEPLKFRPVIDYLEAVGQSPEGEKWRFLAQAVYLSRFVMNDTDLALKLANQLAAHKNPNMPSWTRQMPAFVMTQAGDKKAAYGLLVEILRSGAKTMAVEEVTNMRYYICDRVLEPEQAKFDPLCKDLP